MVCTISAVCMDGQGDDGLGAAACGVPSCNVDYEIFWNQRRIGRREFDTLREWLKAHVYAAPVLDARMSKLNALCKIQDAAKADAPVEENKLLYVDGISNGTTAQGTEAQN